MSEFKKTQQEITNVLGAEFIGGVLRDNLLGVSIEDALELIDGLRHQSIEENILLAGAYRVLVVLLPPELRDLDGIELAIADLLESHADELRSHVLSLHNQQDQAYKGDMSADATNDSLQRHQSCQAGVRATGI